MHRTGPMSDVVLYECNNDSDGKDVHCRTGKYIYAVKPAKTPLVEIINSIAPKRPLMIE